MNKSQSPSFFAAYLNEGRSVSLNLYYIVPLLVLYELGIQLTGSDLRNAAEVIIKDLGLLIGASGTRYFHLFLMGVILLCCFRILSKEQPVHRYFPLMVSESLAFALVLGPFLSCLVGAVFLEYPLTTGEETGFSVQILLSIGAGVYEELLFRLLILGGSFLIFCKVFKAPYLFGALLSLMISSLTFAAYHHLGVNGLPISNYLFFFRFGAGLILGYVFMTRGLGVAVYLHVFYDIFRDIELYLDSANG